MIENKSIIDDFLLKKQKRGFHSFETLSFILT